MVMPELKQRKDLLNRETVVQLLDLSLHLLLEEIQLFLDEKLDPCPESIILRHTSALPAK